MGPRELLHMVCRSVRGKRRSSASTQRCLQRAPSSKLAWALFSCDQLSSKWIIAIAVSNVFCTSISSGVIIVDSLEPLWVAVLQPARATSTSCVHVSKTACFSRTERCTVTNTGISSVTRYENSCSFLSNIYFKFIFVLDHYLKVLD